MEEGAVGPPCASCGEDECSFCGEMASVAQALSSEQEVTPDAFQGSSTRFLYSDAFIEDSCAWSLMFYRWLARLEGEGLSACLMV